MNRFFYIFMERNAGLCSCQRISQVDTFMYFLFWSTTLVGSPAQSGCQTTSLSLHPKDLLTVLKIIKPTIILFHLLIHVIQTIPPQYHTSTVPYLHSVMLNSTLIKCITLFINIMLYYIIANQSYIGYKLIVVAKDCSIKRWL